ncbi:hypothetical protein LJC45_00440 [Alistipes sp. OttesenSCG-928-B03]|nr:hypothetical protein [Alistipes sp. OttesenSCG-928-B03]
MRIIKTIFNKRFFKYFCATFAVVLLVVALMVPLRYIDDVVYSGASFGDACRLGWLAMGVMLTESVCIAIAVASFFAFRHLPATTNTRAFVRTLVVGFVCLTPLAAGIWLYDQHIQPCVKAQTAGAIYEMRAGAECGHDFLNESPSLSTVKALAEATLELESRLAAAQETDECYYEIVYELRLCRVERVLRAIGAVACLAGYLLFAVVGYLSRNRTMKKILGILAVIIVAVMLVSSVSGMVGRYMKNVETQVRW